MAYKRSFGPSVINSNNAKLVQNGTSAGNKTALSELAFWLPLTIPELDSRVKGVSTFKELLRLPKAHIAHILSKLVQIIRQRKDVNGKRYTNVRLKVKVESWQRVIRSAFQAEYERLVLVNPKTPVRKFNIYEDPELKILLESLDAEMRKSAALGLTSGNTKRQRSDVTPKHIKQIMQL